MATRRDVRQRYNIEGGGGGDLYVIHSLYQPYPIHSIHLSCSSYFSACTWCCIPCVLTQESRELGLEEKSLTGGQQV